MSIDQRIYSIGCNYYLFNKVSDIINGRGGVETILVVEKEEGFFAKNLFSNFSEKYKLTVVSDKESLGNILLEKFDLVIVVDDFVFEFYGKDNRSNILYIVTNNSITYLSKGLILEGSNRKYYFLNKNFEFVDSDADPIAMIVEENIVKNEKILLLLQFNEYSDLVFNLTSIFLSKINFNHLCLLDKNMNFDIRNESVVMKILDLISRTGKSWELVFFKGYSDSDISRLIDEKFRDFYYVLDVNFLNFDVGYNLPSDLVSLYAKSDKKVLTNSLDIEKRGFIFYSPKITNENYYLSYPFDSEILELV